MRTWLVECCTVTLTLSSDPCLVSPLTPSSFRNQSAAHALPLHRSTAAIPASSPPTFRTTEEYAPRVRVRGAVLGLVFVALVAAPVHASTSPCSLATVAEVHAAFGGTVGKGKVDTSLPS